MNYSETLDFLYSILPMYQRSGASAFKKDLNNTLELLNALDNPHKKFKSVHIAGTNGKGTSAHGIAAILQSAGYKTGLYTSPHLKRFTERIKLNGQEVDESFVVEFTRSMQSHIEKIRPSFFEVTVVMAFQYFAQCEVDIAVIETGLGGRLDSTNVIIPEVALITNIGMDHTDLLGDTPEQIAREKSGIIKEKVPVVLGRYQEDVFHVFEAKARETNSELILPSNNLPELHDLPYYKSENLSGILSVTDVLARNGWNISPKNCQDGLTNMEELTSFKGRFQVLNDMPLTIADVSHNTDGLSLLFSRVNERIRGRLFLIFGTVRDKDLDPIFDLFPRQATFIWTQSHVPRALPAKDLQKEAKRRGFAGSLFTDVNQAIDFASEESDPQDVILVTGSTFVVSEIRDL